MVKYVKGDLLESNCNYICHQVNCQGAMNSGIAKQIRERFPGVYESYRELCYEFGATTLLGTFDIVGTKAQYDIVNIFSQLNYGYDKKRYTSYDAFANALDNLKGFIPYGTSIGFPKNIGCGLGGANWNVIVTIIDEILGTDYDVYIYELEE